MVFMPPLATILDGFKSRMMAAVNSLDEDTKECLRRVELTS